MSKTEKVFKDDLVEVTYLQGRKKDTKGQLHKLHAKTLESKGIVRIGPEVEKKKKKEIPKGI